jgi:hypothetical protein
MDASRRALLQTAIGASAAWTSSWPLAVDVLTLPP